MNIDIHAHFIPNNCLDDIRNTRSASGQSGAPIDPKLFDLQLRIKDMDAAGVDMQVLSPLPSAAYYNLEPEACLQYSRRQNDGIAQTVKERPDRFSGMAMVPLQSPDKAIAELDRAINELGLRGVEILANVNGRDLDSPELMPFFKEVEVLDVPVFIHPAQVAGSDRMKDYYLQNLIGNPLDTTLAAAHIIFGGILEKLPGLKFCLAHGGGYLPYQRGRWERGYQVRTESKSIIKQPPSHYIPLLYFDTITHFPPALEYLINSVGADKIVMATDYPYDMGDPAPVLTVKSLKNVSDEDKKKILGDNAKRLFKL